MAIFSKNHESCLNLSISKDVIFLTLPFFFLIENKEKFSNYWGKYFQLNMICDFLTIRSPKQVQLKLRKVKKTKCVKLFKNLNLYAFQRKLFSSIITQTINAWLVAKTFIALSLDTKMFCWKYISKKIIIIMNEMPYISVLV